MGKVITVENPLYEVIIEGIKIQLLKGSLRTPKFKGFTQDVNIAKSMVKLHNNEAEYRTRIEMKGIQLKVNGYK